MKRKISAAELSRLNSMSFHEKKLSEKGFQRIAGIDEAGRGPLAGPVVAAACILPKNTLFENLNDSKQLTSEERETLFQSITACPGLFYGIGIATVEEIDRINILQATMAAMKRAESALTVRPDYILIDGNQLPFFETSCEGIVQGDGLSISIAAASILAKVTRDRIMAELDEKWPNYGFKQHKGYATARHLEAIRKWGPCPVHRASFEPVKSMFSANFEFDLQL